MDDQLETLLLVASRIAGEIKLRDGCNAGTVGAALRAADGQIYTGICLHLSCGIGFCAEHAAVAEMLKARVTKIEAIVAADSNGRILSPCGRCRELMFQVDQRNGTTEIVLPGRRVSTLAQLLPEHWLNSHLANS